MKPAARHVFRWDLDKTYLRTEFDSFGDLVKSAIETAAGPQKAIAFTINKNSYRYARDLSEERIASILSTAKGEFGSSADYLMRTVSELRAAGIRDRTLERLFTSVSQQNPTSSTG